MPLRKIDDIVNGNRRAITYKDVEWSEFRVRFFESGAYLAGADYHTDDMSDAIYTAAREIGLSRTRH